MKGKFLHGAALSGLLLAVGAAPAAAAQLDNVGFNQPFNILQPSLAINTYIRTSTSTSGDFDRLGELYFHAAGNGSLGMRADGRLLNINEHQSLFAKIGTTYGGDGQNTFAIPDLRGRAITGVSDTRQAGDVRGNNTHRLTVDEMPAHSHVSQDDGEVSGSAGGNGHSFSVEQPNIALHFDINRTGPFPTRTGSPGNSQAVGFITVDAADDNTNLDGGRLAANGQTVQIAGNEPLFAITGATYGGDGQRIVGTPDTRDRLIVGAGRGSGLNPAHIGQKSGQAITSLTSAQLPIHTHADPEGEDDFSFEGGSARISMEQESLVLNWIVALTGVFPSFDTEIPSPDQRVIGEMNMFAGPFAPAGYALAQGQLLSIANHVALFSLFGTTYGGDGQTNFALPDMRGRTLIGADDGLFRAGTVHGNGSINLTVGNLPAHTHSINAVSAVPVPAALPLLATGLGWLGFMGWRGRRTIRA